MEDDKNLLDIAIDNNNMLDIPQTISSNPIIKVVGVGGGGGNAVNHMYKEGIIDVSFAVCNLDKQALEDSPVPVHIQLGEEGLGAGNRPEVARKAAEDTLEPIRSMLNDGTKMAFITAGMGGGTGTGAAPIIARESMNLGILTVGIVTIPFKFEGNKKINQALDGVEAMAKNVDALLVINNERLRSVYSDMSVVNAFGKADDTLSVAAKSIAEIITVHGDINLDFNDVKTVLKQGGVAIMSTGFGEGEDRVKKAIEDALHSPLLNDNDVFNSKRVLLNVSYNNEEGSELMMDEMSDVHNFMDKFNSDFELKWGISTDKSLGNKVKVTLLATGFGLRDIDKGFAERQEKTDKETEQIEAWKREEEQRRNDKRIDDYYGKDPNGLQAKTKSVIFTFSVADLDNDDIIIAVEDQVTKNRSRQQLESISRLSNAKTISVNNSRKEKPESSSEEENDIISFG